MISVLPIREKELLTALYEKEKLAITEHSDGVAAKCGEELLGYCLFEWNEKGMTVLTLSPQDDLMLADAILRSALHVAAQRCAMDARYADRAPEELFRKLQFITDPAQKKLDIDRLFRGCGCKAETK